MSNPQENIVQGLTLNFEFLKDVDWTKLAYAIGRDVIEFVMEQVVPKLREAGDLVRQLVDAILIPVLTALKAWVQAQIK